MNELVKRVINNIKVPLRSLLKELAKMFQFVFFFSIFRFND